MTQLFKTLHMCVLLVVVGTISMSTVTPVEAQQTTATVKGVVYESDGYTAKANASIEVIHVDSGARATATTNDTGSYRLTGLRPGGPYTVAVVGTDVREEGVYLNISAPTDVDLRMGEGVLEEVLVLGTVVDVELRMGASTVIGKDEIAGIASIGRDFKNVIRLDPRVTLDPANQNAIQIGGFNNRLNSLTVDGVRQNDEFGLNQSGFPTQRTPVSIDAIEQISVESAPFSVEFGGFQGGTINMVTKSGGNEFHGGVFYFWSDDSLLGDKSEDREIDSGEFDEKFFGGTFSGPIIKDKLWFFASYEKFEASDPDATLWGPAGSSRAITVEDVTQADLDLVQQISQDVYGYDPLGLLTSSAPVEDEKWLVKIDWQINEDHNANFTYQDVVGNDLIPQGNSTSSGRLGMASNFYNRGEAMEAYSFQLFSRWTDSFSTEIKYASKDIENLQDPLGGMEFAEMEVDLESGGSIRFGPDSFRHANFLFTENTQFTIKGDYVWGDHVFTAGYELDEVWVFNIFAPDSLGSYSFDSIEDFENQMASSLFTANISATGDVFDLGGQFENTVHSFYLQDRWDIRDNIVLQFGIRLDEYSSSDKPFLNENFLARNGFDNTATLDGRNVWMPRFGINWQPSENTTIRGGAGLFSGGVPIGFISNSFSNVGILNMGGFFGSSSMAGIEVDGFNIDPAILDQLEPGDGNVAALDPDYDIPSTWKINMAWDQVFDIGNSEGYMFTADLILAYVKDAPIWTELRRQQIGNAADGRPIYGEIGCETDDPFTSDCRQIPNWDILMTNTDQGTNHSFALSLSKLFDWGRGGVFNAFVSWTYMDVSARSDALSSTPTSLVGREQTSDRVTTQLGRSSFETTNRFVGAFTWRKDFMKNLTSSINLFISSQTGKPYGHTYNAPRTSFGDTFGGNEPVDDDDTQLLYVPSGPNDPIVMYGSGFDLDGFNAMIDKESCLKRGKISKKNACTSPSYTRADLRFTQEIRIPSIRWLSDSNLQFIIDIENLGNLLNSDWGRYEQISFPFRKATVTLDGDLGPNGELIYNSFRDFGPNVSNSASLWKIQFGLRYNF